jgi:hypothetical protein
MNIELSKDDLALIEMLLAQEESEINIEIHHCRNISYKEYLHERQIEIHDILERIRNAQPTVPV